MSLMHQSRRFRALPRRSVLPAGERTLGEIGRQSREEIAPHGADLAIEPFVTEGLGRLSHRRFHFEWAEGPGTATAGDCHRKDPDKPP